MLVTVENNIRVEMEWEDCKNLPSTLCGKPFYNIICFTFDSDKETHYYEKDYVKKCMASWKKVFPFSRLIYINVEKAAFISKWTMKTLKRKNFPTDSLRLYFVGQLDNAFYIDTDVYLSEYCPLPLNKECFVVSDCSGTLLYNKKKNNKNLLSWFRWYEKTAETLRDDDDADKNCDCEVWRTYGKYLVPSIYSEMPYVSHFSNLWPYFRDKELITLDGCHQIVARYSDECYWAFMSYCLERKYIDSVKLFDRKAKYSVSFMTIEQPHYNIHHDTD